MLIVGLMWLPLWAALAGAEETLRERRQSPFADGIQPPLHKFEPRRVVPTHAHRKSEPWVTSIFRADDRR